MKKAIKIAHLYYDIMNLYGENGNVAALVKFIERQGIKAEVSKLSLEDAIDFKKYDLFYIGSGSEDDEMLVLSDLYTRRDAIEKAIENGKMFLVTGNAMELFGHKIRTVSGRTIAFLGLLDYNSVEAKKRIIGEIFYEFPELDENCGRNIVGFKNCNSTIVNNEEVRPFGTQDNVQYKNFFGLMIEGPVLIRNPYFTDYLLERLFRNLGLTYVQNDEYMEYKAYHEYVKNFIKSHK